MPTHHPGHDRAPDLRDAVAGTLAAMTWLGPTDDGLRALALRQAEEIERAVDRAELLAEVAREVQDVPGSKDRYDLYKKLDKLAAMCDVTKVVGWLGPQLQGVLRDLGGAPAARKALQPDKPIGNRLAQLRAIAKDDDQGGTL